jgi:hypothetical protein
MKSRSMVAIAAYVAIVASSILSVAPASAAFPEFSGKFPVTFTATSNAVLMNEKSGGGSYECTSSSMSGTITGPKEVEKVVIKYNHCSGICMFEPRVTETKELKGVIGYISAKEKTVGLLLEPVAEPFAKCETVTSLQGSIIGTLGPVDRFQTGFALNYEAESGKGEQRVKKLEGEAVNHGLDRLHGGIQQKFGVETKEPMTFTTSKALEIKA